MNETVYTFFHTNEYPEVRDIFYNSLYLFPLRIPFVGSHPWVRLNLLHAERDSPVLRVYGKYLNLHGVVNLQLLRGMLNLRPRYL